MRRYRQPLGSAHCAAAALARSIIAKEEWKDHRRHMPRSAGLYDEEMTAAVAKVFAELHQGTHKSLAKLTDKCKAAASPAKCPCTKVCVRCTCEACVASPSGGLFSKKMLNLVFHHGRYEVTGPHSTVPCSLGPACQVCSVQLEKQRASGTQPLARPAAVLPRPSEVPVVGAHPPAAAPASRRAVAVWRDMPQQSGREARSSAAPVAANISRGASAFEPVRWESAPRAEEPALLGGPVYQSRSTPTPSLIMEDAGGAWASGAAAGDPLERSASFARASIAGTGFVADALPRSASGASFFYDPIDADISMCNTMSLIDDLSAQFDAEEIAPTLVERLRGNISEMRALLMAGLDARPDVGMDYSERVRSGVVSGESRGGSKSETGASPAADAYAAAARKRPGSAGVRSATAGRVAARHESEASVAAKRVRNLGVSAVVCVRLDNTTIVDAAQSATAADKPAGATVSCALVPWVGGGEGRGALGEASVELHQVLRPARERERLHCEPAALRVLPAQLVASHSRAWRARFDPKRSHTVCPVSLLPTPRLNLRRSSSVGTSSHLQPRTPARLARIVEVHSPDSEPVASCIVEFIGEVAGAEPSGASAANGSGGAGTAPSPKRRRIVVRCENIVPDRLGENLRTFDKALGDLAETAVWALEDAGVNVDEWREELRAKSVKIGVVQYP